MESTFRIDQKSLAAVLSSMQPICAKRTTLDATTSILFQADHKELILKSTDLEISLQYSCGLHNSDIEQGSSFLLSGKRVFDLVKELDGEIQFSLEASKVSLLAGAAELSLHVKDAQEFPPFPERIENLMQLDAAILRSMLEKVSFLIPQNNANPALNGLFIEVSDKELKMTATNGHCLAQVRSAAYALEKPVSWLVPRRAIFELKKIIDNTPDKTIFLGVCGNQLVFSGESFNFFTKLLADPFPHYQPILDKTDFVQGCVKRVDLVKALRRSACLLSGQFIPTQLSFDETMVTIAMQNKEVGALQEKIALDNYTGSSLEIRFYAPYLLNGLQVLQDDSISFFLISSSRPIIIETKDQSLEVTYLVMPVSPTA